jgi:hypothetical protein
MDAALPARCGSRRQLLGDVAVAATIAAVGQHQPLDRVARRGVVLTRRAGLPEAVIAGAADARHPAQALDRDLALRHRVSFLGALPRSGCFAVFCGKISAKCRLSVSDSLGFSVGMRLRKQQRTWLFVAVPGCFREAADRKCMAAGDYQFDSEIASVIPI